jgi:hypothetical protein
MQSGCNKDAMRMQSKTNDPKSAIQHMEPNTKSALNKSMFTNIEDRIKAGVSLVQIVDALNQTGVDISLATLKSYLYRLRKSSMQMKERAPSPTLAHSDSHAKSTLSELEPTPTRKGFPDASTPGISPHVLDALINPDPVQQAEDLSKYERLAKLNRRKP